MKPTGMRPIILCAVLVLLDACTMNGLAQSTTVPLPAPVVMQPTSHMRPSDRMLYWYEESRELHAMAMHREREAELILRKKPGPATNEFVRQMRVFAHQLHETAAFADAQAKEAEQEIPPDMITQLDALRR